MSIIPFRLLHSRIFRSNNSLNTLYATVAKAIPNSDADKIETYLQECERGSEVFHRVRPKKPKRPPFTKNLFLGQFDAEMLTYPQLEKEDADNLKKLVATLTSSVSEQKYSNVKLFVENLAKEKLLGLQAPNLIGGRNLNATESSRLFESLGNQNHISNVISNEYLGIQALLKFGNDQQKIKYLARLMAGEITCSFCLLEQHICNGNSLYTKAKQSGNKEWIINGEKIWALNGGSADLFIILAETGTLIKDGIDQVLITAFLVERNQQGVLVTKCPLNVDNLDMSNIKLENVCVPSENVLGNVDDGKSILQAVVPEYRVNCVIPSVAITKRMINDFTKFCIDISSTESPLCETEEVLSLIGQFSVQLYAMESILYLTTGLMDQYENQDCELEAAIVKTFNAEQAYNCITSCINFVGTSSLSKGHWCNRIHQDALKLLALQESQDNMKVMISLMGLQHAGMALNDLINKIRNPLFNSGFILKRILAQRRHVNDNPKLNLGLEYYLHPSLKDTAKTLEYCVLRLQFGTELLLSRYGSEVINQHINLKRLAESVMDIYAMIACLGRASRSYCIGLHNSEYEMLIANVFCNLAKERVKSNINKIFIGEVNTNDKNHKVIAEKVFKSKEFFACHPLTRNF